MRVSLVVKVPAGRNAGSLVKLRSTLDSEVFLACLTDASGQIQAWLELWRQSTAVLRNTSLAQRVLLSNAVWDDRWHKRVQAFDQLGTAEKVTTGWETSPPLPTFLDVEALSPMHPKDGQTGTCWQLCRDEGILQSHGVPPYAGSLHRYLYLPELGSETPLVPVTQEAPTNDRTRSLSAICPNHASLIPFNPAAGLILVTKRYPLELEGFLDLLGGADQHPESSRPTQVRVLDVDPGPGRNSGAVPYPGRLFFESQGKYSRLIEVFHLKLVLLSQIVSAVHAVVRCVQQPLLNLGAESFQVDMDRSPGPLPFLWTACPRLVEPGHALAMHLGPTDLTYYASPLLGETSVYRPAVTSLPARGKALVRIRQTPSESQTTTMVEGTLATQERLELGESDLIILQLPLACGPLSLCAHAQRDSALAADEYRFRALPHRLDEGQIEGLRSAQGVPLPGVAFEVIQPLSSPCDLYSLAIVAIRTLLVGRGASLPIAVDEMLSLARQVQTGPDPSEPLPAGVGRVFRSDPRWLPSVGPHHLTEEEIAPEDALGLVPPDLWWSALAMVVRMFPGLGPASSCRDYGDARAGGLHLVFERTLSDLSELILKTRYLVTPDLKSDRQIAAVIRRYLERQTEQDSDTANPHRHRK